jgi:hypothetical protein
VGRTDSFVRSENRVGSRLWLGDIRRLLMANLLAYGGRVWMVTVTAPGADVLPWDGVRIEAAAAEAWNRTAAARWRELHWRAYQETRRRFGPDVLRTLARVWQLQKRGAPHVHLVLGSDSPLEVAAARFYVSCLRARRQEFAFGFVNARDRDGRTGRATVMEPHRAAGYLSRYLGESAPLLQAIALASRPRQLVWVALALKRASGVTMRRLRRARYLWWIRRNESIVFAFAGRHPAWFPDPARARRGQRSAALTRSGCRQGRARGPGASRGADLPGRIERGQRRPVTARPRRATAARRRSRTVNRGDRHGAAGAAGV